ncbi:chlorophyll synthesis pathway protein BchC [Roseospirillum parvum]|uniref:3-hydroxyethyl bacteriochlorophyllide a dehydrogenase n=1 Tax=Roseospirillum parvum TaxID=83401 RepID=A0A1G8BUI2_9PROT|nr:chlorophyll synthesis pathway protein BchC [Roseospirillum parvum]SDH36380.1 3-hydroxyethyl bacteriochlorophyllide a dehydrogenase [Roseospirillum parvum]
MDTLAVVMEQPQRLALSRLALDPAGDADVVVDIAYSGISTGTERLLWTGRMPPFPGLGYPLVPGYESVGRISAAGPQSGRQVGETVFVPGAKCYGEVRGLFGGAAARVVVPGARVLPLPEGLEEQGVLLALAATAWHVTGGDAAAQPELIVGHGVLGRLLARVAVALGASPTVWETNPARAEGAEGYRVVSPADDGRMDYHRICDVSGDSGLLDSLIGRLAPGGEVVLAGFYDQPLHFDFPPAFMREARIRVAAEFRPADLTEVTRMIAEDRLDLSGLITHRVAAPEAATAYETAFGDAACLKMVLDWRTCQ